MPNKYCGNCGIVIGGLGVDSKAKSKVKRIEQETYQVADLEICRQCYELLQERGWIYKEINLKARIIFKDGTVYLVNSSVLLRKLIRRYNEWKELKERCEYLGMSLS